MKKLAAVKKLPSTPVATGRMRKFEVQMTLTVIVEMDEAVLAEVDNDDWRSTFYQLHGPEAIAEHLAFNHVFNGVESNQIMLLDGFARLTPDMVNFDLDRDPDMDGQETTQCPFVTVRGGRKLRCVRTIHDSGSHTIRTKKGEHRLC